MKLAFVIFRYFPFGGLQRDMLAIAQAAHARGHQITIFCGRWEGDRIPGIEVVEIPSRRFFNVAGVEQFVTRFQQEFDKAQFDLLVGFNKMPGLDVYYCGDSCFAQKAFGERGMGYRLTPRARLYLAYEAAVYSFLSHTHILEVSSAERPVFARFYGTRAERHSLLPPGIDRALVLAADQRATARACLRRELGLTEADKLLLCVGSGFRTKGLDRSLRILAALRKQNPHVYLVVVGNGNFGPFEGLVRSLGLASAVRVLGGREDMAHVYAAGDLLLHPAYREVTGNVIVEAMVAGLPVAATAVCGYAHYIRAQDMGVVLQAPDDAPAVATELMALLRVPAEHWQQKAAALVQTGDWFARPERAVIAMERLATQPSTAPLSQKTADYEWVLCDEFKDAWRGQDVFAAAQAVTGPVAREMPDRQTLRFEENGQAYYRKWHRGVGWGEILKNLIRLRLPVVGAQPEWEALTKLQALGIPSLIPVAFGKRGRNPATQQSFIVTRELRDVIQLDHYFEQYSVAIKTRRAILHRLAAIARDLHGAGINHRDFYLCHFMLKPASLEAGGSPELYVIDLHRAQCRVQVPLRWLIKDLGALYFSAMNLGFSQREGLRFLRVYFNRPVREIIQSQAALLRAVRQRALKMYRREFGHEPAIPLVRGVDDRHVF